MNNRYFKNCTGMIHYVKRGDTLYSISRMHGVSIDELIEVNPFVNVYNMQEGDEICVPVSYNEERRNNREMRMNQRRKKILIEKISMIWLKDLTNRMVKIIINKQKEKIGLKIV